MGELFFNVKMVEGFTLFYHPGSYLGQCVSGGTYEDAQTALIKNTVGKDWLFIDVGAGIGYYSLLAANLGCEVVAYEPRRSNYEALVESVRNAEAVGRSIVPIRAAVGDHDGLITLGINPVNDGDNRVAGNYPWEREEVLCVTLDEMAQTVLPPVGKLFIKMDVQGSELAVLRGARKLIERYRPTMLVEDSPAHVREAGETQTLREVLTGLNYSFLELDPRDDFFDLWAVPNEAAA